MVEKEDNATTSKQISGVYGFFLLVIGFSVVIGGLFAKGVSWLLPGLVLLIVGYWSVCRADIVVEEVEDKKKRGE